MKERLIGKKTAVTVGRVEGIREEWTMKWHLGEYIDR
jgi:hypothetical protein